MPPPLPPEEQLPGACDNPFNCPVCGFSPCADDCRLGFTEYDLEDFDLMWRDWTAELGDIADEQQA